MPCHNLIVVRIMVDGRPLREYNDPNESTDNQYASTRYVEVKAGQCFEIRIIWKEGFKLQQAPYLAWNVYIDDGNVYSSFQIDTTTVIRNNYMLTKSIYQYLKSRRRCNHSTGLWTESPLAFGALGTNEDANNNNITPEQVANLGQIKIQCYRANQTLREQPFIWDGKVDPVEEISEKMLKGKAIKNTVQFLTGTPTTPSPPVHYSWDPIRGKHGTYYEFCFLYRSRKTLQSLGLIPRTPSPEPDVRLMLERTEEMLRAAKRQQHETDVQMRQLQQRLDQAEAQSRKIIVKAEAGIAGVDPSGTTIKATTGAGDNTLSRAKRCREDKDDELAEVAPPMQKAKVVIDLTEDD